MFAQLRAHSFVDLVFLNDRFEAEVIKAPFGRFAPVALSMPPTATATLQTFNESDLTGRSGGATGLRGLSAFVAQRRMPFVDAKIDEVIDPLTLIHRHCCKHRVVDRKRPVRSFFLQRVAPKQHSRVA